jgi:hypothetical protein
MLSARAEEFLRQTGIEWLDINGIVVRLRLPEVVPPWTGYMLASDFQKFAEWRALRAGSAAAQQNAFLALPAPFLVTDLGALLPYLASFRSDPENPDALRAMQEWLEASRDAALFRASERSVSTVPRNEMTAEENQ